MDAKLKKSIKEMFLGAHVLEALEITIGAFRNFQMDGIMKMIGYIPIQEDFKTERCMELKLELLTEKIVIKSKDQFSLLSKTGKFVKLLTTITTLMSTILYLVKVLFPLILKE